MKALIEKLPGLMAALSGLVVVVASLGAAVSLRTMIFRMTVAMAIALGGGSLARWFLIQQVGISAQKSNKATTGYHLDVTVAEDKFEDLKDVLTAAPSGEKGASGAESPEVDPAMLAKAVQMSMKQER